MWTTSKHARSAAMLFVAAVTSLAAACGGEEAPASQPQPGAAQPTTSPPGGHQIPVKMTDFRLELPQSNLPPGSHTFVGTNAGQASHALEIEGAGIDEQTPVVPPGQSVNLTVTLKPGTYELYCPVGNHKGLGMTTKITVAGTSG